MSITIHNRILHEGEGTPLVLLNAYPIDGRMWEECAARLVARAEAAGVPAPAIWAPDMPGSGQSPTPGAADSGRRLPNGSYPDALDRVAEAYVAMLRAAGHDRAVWCGLSMGGYLACDIARLHPETVAGLALCDTMASSDGVGGEGRLRMADAAEGEAGLEAVMHFARPAEGDSTVKRSPAFIKRMSAWIGEQHVEGVAWRQRMTHGRPDLTGVPETVEAPIAVVTGTLDPTSNPDVMRPLAERIGERAALTVIEDCGHFSAVEHPDEVARALLALVTRAREN